MRVINETNWRTDQLKKLAMEVAYRESSLSTDGRKGLKIKFGFESTKVFRGNQRLPGSIRIKVPRTTKFYSPTGYAALMGFEARVELAQTLTWVIGIAV